MSPIIVALIVLTGCGSIGSDEPATETGGPAGDDDEYQPTYVACDLLDAAFLEEITGHPFGEPQDNDVINICIWMTSYGPDLIRDWEAEPSLTVHVTDVRSWGFTTCDIHLEELSEDPKTHDLAEVDSSGDRSVLFTEEPAGSVFATTLVTCAGDEIIELSLVADEGFDAEPVLMSLAPEVIARL